MCHGGIVGRRAVKLRFQRIFIRPVGVQHELAKGGVDRLRRIGHGAACAARRQRAGDRFGGERRLAAGHRSRDQIGGILDQVERGFIDRLCLIGANQRHRVDGDRQGGRRCVAVAVLDGVNKGIGDRARADRVALAVIAVGAVGVERQEAEVGFDHCARAGRDRGRCVAARFDTNNTANGRRCCRTIGAERVGTVGQDIAAHYRAFGNRLGVGNRRQPVVADDDLVADLRRSRHWIIVAVGDRHARRNQPVEVERIVIGRCRETVGVMFERDQLLHGHRAVGIDRDDEGILHRPVIILALDDIGRRLDERDRKIANRRLQRGCARTGGAFDGIDGAARGLRAVGSKGCGKADHRRRRC